MGCTSISVKDALNAEINGSFKLQPKSYLTARTPLIAMCENSQSSVEEAISNNDEVDDIGNSAATSDQGGSISSIPLSKKAIHQRDADENLFLRFLELDPPQTENVQSTPPAQTTDTRRKSTFKSGSIPNATPQHTKGNPNGRTPFTITKKLTRTPEKGFGFSIVWTHPPRIEKVEAGLSADRCGIFPGDYVIFVDKHNVVTMPEMDILNLIKSQGNTLVLEIFRRTGSTRKFVNGAKPRAPSLTVSANNNDEIASETATPKQSSTSLAPRPLTACSNTSMEISKRRLHLPQVTFSKEVGQGVIV